MSVDPTQFDSFPGDAANRARGAAQRAGRHVRVPNRKADMMRAARGAAARGGGMIGRLPATTAVSPAAS